MSDDIKPKQLSISVPGEWAAQKVLGPTLSEIGDDLQKVYKLGRDKIIAAAKNKIKNIDDNATANLRVARDVFWNGAFTDEAICAEYFGGILASSRSQNGKDDTGVYYTDILKSLSSKQIHLHYVIYNCLNRLLIKDETKKDLNVGMSTELQRVDVFFATVELEQGIHLKIDTDLEALYRRGLLFEYKTQGHELPDNQGTLPYTQIKPTVLGVQLLSIAYNNFNNWREFPIKPYPDFENIALPRHFEFSLEKLVEKAFPKSVPAEGV